MFGSARCVRRAGVRGSRGQVRRARRPTPAVRPRGLPLRCLLGLAEETCLLRRELLGRQHAGVARDLAQRMAETVRPGGSSSTTGNAGTAAGHAELSIRGTCLRVRGARPRHSRRATSFNTATRQEPPASSSALHPNPGRPDMPAPGVVGPLSVALLEANAGRCDRSGRLSRQSDGDRVEPSGRPAVSQVRPTVEDHDDGGVWTEEFGAAAPQRATASGRRRAGAPGLAQRPARLVN